MKKIIIVGLFILMLSSIVLAENKTWQSIECKSDINQDGMVDIQDFGLLKSNMGMRVRYHINKNKILPYKNQPIELINSDIDSNGIVGLRDYLLFKRYFGTIPEGCR